MSVEVAVYHFAQGIPGFEEIREFQFIEVGNELPMMLMKAVEDKAISLLVASPFIFYPEYEWELTESIKDELEIVREEDIEVWTVLTVPEDPTKATVNLLAPIVLNINKKKGKQIILNDRSFSTRAPLNRN